MFLYGKSAMFSAAANVSPCCLRGNPRRMCLPPLRVEEAETGFDPFMGLFADPLMCRTRSPSIQMPPRSVSKNLTFQTCARRCPWAIGRSSIFTRPCCSNDPSKRMTLMLTFVYQRNGLYETCFAVLWKQLPSLSSGEIQGLQHVRTSTFKTNGRFFYIFPTQLDPLWYIVPGKNNLQVI
jgi:hypothetical protein